MDVLIWALSVMGEVSGSLSQGNPFIPTATKAWQHRSNTVLVLVSGILDLSLDQLGYEGERKHNEVFPSTECTYNFYVQSIWKCLTKEMDS